MKNLPSMQNQLWRLWRVGTVVFLTIVICHADVSGRDIDFVTDVAPILSQHCVRCHDQDEPDGDLSLTSADLVVDGVGQGWAVVPGDLDASSLWEVVQGDEPRMPKNSPPLSADQREILRQWIVEGAAWPRDTTLRSTEETWWSLRKIEQPSVPAVARNADTSLGPIDAFVLDRLHQQDLGPSPPADRRTLIRRLYFDLLGLPPDPDAVDRFVADDHPLAYERLVDRLLASPRYGERWARHWLDVAHYADTHGYDKDKVRPNAWPYRDYVIEAFNQDKSYSQFVREQLAGDVIAGDQSSVIPALGFIAAGPFDWVGQIEVAESTMEGRRVRNLDRDDMVATTMNTFTSMTAQCARCHNHKFDPISQVDYYRLQSVFAAVDRADRPFYPDARQEQQQQQLQTEIDDVTRSIDETEHQFQAMTGNDLASTRQTIERLTSLGDPLPASDRFGYHSQIALTPEVEKWVQIDLGSVHSIEHILLFPCHDTFNNIGAGFGFPPRFKVEISTDSDFATNVVRVADHTSDDVPNPGVRPVAAVGGATRGRYVRVTATRLAPRQQDYIFALSELVVLDKDGTNVAAGATVRAIDSIEAAPRWRTANLTDGNYYGLRSETDHGALAVAIKQHDQIAAVAAQSPLGQRLNALRLQRSRLQAELQSLAEPRMVYAAATDFQPQGNFKPTAGQPREIFVLNRGDEQQPDRQRGPVDPGALEAIELKRDYFGQSDAVNPRQALADWITDRDNPLTWRSIVNRVWQYHFGRGIVDSPNDFGRMGGSPSHPELLDFLAAEFRDSEQSLKSLHRMICTSATYRQSVRHDRRAAEIDGQNRLLWRANRQKLDAEAIRDSALWIAGRMDFSMGGPGFREFGFRDDHSPHYDYAAHDPDQAETSRRSIYRFIVRSVPDPLMTTLDCADPSISVAKRGETLTSLQALAMMNDHLLVRLAEHFADRLQRTGLSPDEQLQLAFRLALARRPTADEHRVLSELTRDTGLANTCRVIFNLNEFSFVD
jgi:hypothetical protein